MTCALDTSYLSTPDFIYRALHITGLIEAPIQVLGAWLIVFKTPKTMSTVKWSMLNLQFWILLLDYTISVLTTPFAVFPTIGGYTMGLLHKLGVPTSIQVHLIITGFGMVLVAMVTVYENRYFILAPRTGSWEDRRFWFLSGYYILMATFLIPFTATVPDQENAVNVVFERIPCLAYFVDKSRVFVYTLRFSAAFVSCGIVFILTAVVIVAFIALTIKILVRDSEHHSQRTLRMQKKFLYGLIAQTSVPVIAMLIPFCHLVLTITKSYYDQALNNFTMLAFSTHGLLSTLAMLLIHKPYRKATFRLFFSCHKKPETRVSDLIKI